MNTSHFSSVLPITQQKIHVTVEANSNCKLYFIHQDHNYTNEILIELIGEHASVELYGLFLGEKKYSFNLSTNVIHSAKNTHSKTEIYGILKDQSSSFYKGVIRVNPKTNGSSGELIYKALLLSDKVIAKPLPSLEILNNNVQVSHSVSVTHLNLEEIFYLNTRGLNIAQSEQLITQSFLAKIKQRITECETDNDLKT